MSRYASLAELKLLVKKGDGDDPALAVILDGAENAIDRFCHRPEGFVAAEGEKLYSGNGTPMLRIDDCVSVTRLEVKEYAGSDSYVEWDEDDYLLASGDVRYPNFNRVPHTLLIVDPSGSRSVFTSGKRVYGQEAYAEPTVKMTGLWGYAEAVPAQIKTATIMQAVRWFNRLRGGMSDALASAELGQVLYVSQLDPDVAMILERGRFLRQTVG